MNDQAECSRFAKWIRGCNFEPRYTTAFPEGLKISLEGVRGSPEAVVAHTEAMKCRTYIHDICTSCGKIVKAG